MENMKIEFFDYSGLDPPVKCHIELMLNKKFNITSFPWLKNSQGNTKTQGVVSEETFLNNNYTTNNFYPSSKSTSSIFTFPPISNSNLSNSFVNCQAEHMTFNEKDKNELKTLFLKNSEEETNGLNTSSSQTNISSLISVDKLKITNNTTDLQIKSLRKEDTINNNLANDDDRKFLVNSSPGSSQISKSSWASVLQNSNSKKSNIDIIKKDNNLNNKNIKIKREFKNVYMKNNSLNNINSNINKKDQNKENLFNTNRTDDNNIHNKQDNINDNYNKNNVDCIDKESTLSNVPSEKSFSHKNKNKIIKNKNKNKKKKVENKKNDYLETIKEYLVIPPTSSSTLLPIGFINRSNWCYVHSVLQCLMNCGPLVSLFKEFPIIPPSISSLPMTKILVDFFNDFGEFSVSNKKISKKGQVKLLPSIEPSSIYKMISQSQAQAFKDNHQEDAEEFLTFVLNETHEEMLKTLKSTPSQAYLSNKNYCSNGNLGEEGTEENIENGNNNYNNDNGKKDEVGDEDLEGWSQVTGKKKATKTVDPKLLEKSPISHLFQGQVSVMLECGDYKTSLVHPFFTLPLHVQEPKIVNISEALKDFAQVDIVTNYTSSKSNKTSDAKQNSLLETLPPILVLHLKWFSYDGQGGLKKNQKYFSVEDQLQIPKEYLTSSAKPKYNSSQRSYQLFAVVVHIGPKAVGGHYATDVYNESSQKWFRCDDNHITSVNLDDVCNFSQNRVPYLVFYQKK